MAQQTLEEIKKLAESMWEGCHGCNDIDKMMWINGFVNGYLIAKSELHGTTNGITTVD